MAFKCPNCGGHVHYSISKKSLLCDYCGELIPMSGDGAPEAEEHQDTLNLTSFVCKSCGAEILSPEESMIGYCSYCGSESMLESRMTEELRPRYIMPFSKTKEECKTAYKRHTEKIPYLPKELKSPEHLEKFRGTYIPYWLYKVDFPEPIQLRAKKRDTLGDEITVTTYDIEANIEGDFEGIPYDASSCFDDTISDMLMPFDKKKLNDFHPGYLAGFYADRADVPGDQYVDEVARRASVNAFDDIALSIKKDRDMDLDEITDERKINSIRPTFRDRFTALFPVWFLTWRNKDRVAYAIVNGQSGKLSSDLPVDMKSFGLWTLATAAVIFGLLTMFVSMTARTALMVCSFLATVILLFLNMEIDSIRERENHVRDKGYFIKDRTVKMPEKKVAKLREKSFSIGGASFSRKNGWLIVLGIFASVVLGMFIGVAEDLEPSVALLGPTFIFAILGTVTAFSSAVALRYVEEKSISLFNLLAFLSVIGAFAVAVWNPVTDYYYYLAAAACGLATAITGVGLIKYYNLLTTRPVPSFFDREGGRDDAKE